MSVLNILIAPNAFKDSLDAAKAADAISAGLRASRLGCRTIVFPIADGGDGTGPLMVERMGGERRVAVAHDALGRPIRACYGLFDGGRSAVVEIAAAAGLALLAQGDRDPLHATSFGAGELVLDALESGARRIVLGVGGSATVDGGTGLMQALGVKFLDAAGRPLVGLPASLADLAKIEMAGIGETVAGMEVVVLCDVDNPILGPSGAARVFGPQKGATAVSVETLEAALKRLCEVLHRQTGRDISTVRGGGAGGGVAAGLAGVFGAQLVNGIDYFLDASGFDEALEGADLVITGEGRIDAQTLRGKAPMGVAIRARQRGVPVIALAGQVSDEPDLALAFDAVWPIAVKPGPLDEAVKRTALDLAAAGRRIGDLIAVDGLAAVKQGKWF